jgi:hypothetical protein
MKLVAFGALGTADQDLILEFYGYSMGTRNPYLRRGSPLDFRSHHAS